MAERSKITAIETRYKGYRFRSRTEARTAVFLDAAGITWRYEEQGYELPSGRYLPDFELGVDGTDPVFLEVKGPEPNEREFRLAAELDGSVGRCMIWSGGMKLAMDGGEALGWVYGGGTWSPTDPGHALDLVYVGRPWFLGGEGEADYTAAITAARSARFEFGESG